MIMTSFIHHYSKTVTAICFILLCFTGALHAASYNGSCGSNMQWSLDTSVGDLMLAGSGNMNTYSNSNHAPWYNYRQHIRRVLMDDAITSVGDYAFDGCTNLKYIYFPVELTSGGRLAVQGCTSLKEVYWNARNLTSYYGPLNQASALEKMVFGDSVRVIGNAVTPPVSSTLRRVEFGPNINQIAGTAFSSCYAVDTIVWNVRRYTFKVSYGYSSPLRCMIIGDSVRYLGRLTASYNAHKIRIPQNVDTILTSAFGVFSGNLDTVIWATRAPHIIQDDFYSGKRLFDGQISQIRAFIFEEGVEVIPEKLCQDMSNVENLHLPSTVDSIGEWAFAGMSNLKRANIPYALRTATADIFNNCNHLQHIRWEAADCRLTENGRSPFYVRIQDSLQTYTFGDSVRVIPAKLCRGESAITNLRIPASVDSIGQDAFLLCRALQTIVVDEANTRYDSREDCNAVIFTASDSLVCGAQYTRIPLSVKYIAPTAFRYLNHLVWAELKNPDVQISSNAFTDITQLDSIYWNVRTMQSTPFYGLYEGTTWIRNSINPNVHYCLFGDSVQHIPADFCKQMTLKEIRLPSSLQTIGSNAFSGCDSLQHIYCASTTPPQGSPSFKTTLYSDATLHVPCGTGDVYSGSTLWGHFTNIVEETDGLPCIIDSLESTPSQQSPAAVKFLRDGQLFIETPLGTFDVTGRKAE